MTHTPSRSRLTPLPWLGVALALLHASPGVHAQIAGSGAVARQMVLTRTEHPWSQNHADPQRTGQSSGLGPNQGQILWQRLVPNPAPGIAVSREGLLQTGDIWNDAAWSGEDFVSALSVSGRLVWRSKIPSFEWGASQGTSSGPAFDPGGNAIVQGAAGMVHKIDRHGDIVWSFTGSGSATNDASPAVLADGSIRAYQAIPGLYALSGDGQLLWSTPLGGGTPAVAASGDLATGAQRSHEPHGFPSVSYFNSNGTVRWIHTTTFGGGSTPVFGPDGTLYVNVSNDGITAFESFGAILWTKSVGSWTQAPALGKNNQLYVASGNGLYALKPQNGAQLWSVSLSGTIRDGLAIDARDVVYATTTNGFICAVQANGVILWQRHLCDVFNHGPALGADGHAFASGRVGFENFVFCIE